MNEFAEKLKEMTKNINDAIVFLNNHHYDTERLIKSTEEFLELNELIMTDLEVKLMNQKKEL